MKSIIFTHGDSDGLCAGALALAAFPDSPIYFTNAVSIMADIENAKGFDRVVISDIAINIPTSGQLKDRIDRLAAVAEVIYIDHHPLPEGFKADWLTSDLTSSASEMTYRYLKDRLPRDMNRVALYGAIGDYRDDSLSVYSLVQDWDKRSLYYQAGTLSQGIEIGRRDYDWKRYLIMQLAKNAQPSDIQDLAKNAQREAQSENEMRLRVRQDVIRMRNLSYVLDEKASIGKAAIYARVYGRTPVGLSAEYREGRDVYDFSLRAIGRINLNPVISRVAPKHGGNGGGHPLAAGGRVPAGNLKEFLRDLDDAIGEELGV